MRPVSGISRFALWSSGEATYGDSMVIKKCLTWSWFCMTESLSDFVFSLVYSLFFCVLIFHKVLGAIIHSSTRLDRVCAKEFRNYKRVFCVVFPFNILITWLSGWFLNLFHRYLRRCWRWWWWWWGLIRRGNFETCHGVSHFKNQ